MNKLNNNLIGVIGLISFCLNMSAQPPTGKKAMCDELIRNKYIFEGKLISKHLYEIKQDDYGTKSYNSYLIEITKIIKGDIKKGTINVLIPIIKVYDGQLPVPPAEGLYFCGDKAAIKDTGVSNTNFKSLEYDCGESMENGELKKDNNDNLIHYFPNIPDFYNYLSANYGVKIEDK